ncbi:MAG: pilus assembly protein [Candidatus Rariloculaceae bacterium]
MSTKINRGVSVCAGALWVLVSSHSVLADDTELFISNAGQFLNTAQPNILFILDTSGSMDAKVTTQATYDPNVDHIGTCQTDRVYWRTGTGDPPGCGSDRWFNETALMCNSAALAFTAGTGQYTDRMAQYDPNNDDRWERVRLYRKNRLVECEDDGGLHGDGSDPTVVYAQNGDDSALWSDDPLDEVAWGQNPTARIYTIYEGNYLNWYYGPTITSTRIQIVKDVATNLLNSVNGVNVGLMRFNESEGGPVIFAMEDIATGRAGMNTAINALPASGKTPLSETLFEAGQYYAGRSVDYGNVDPAQLSVASSREPGNTSAYNSPMEYGCQKNFTILLTDGAPIEDVGANSKITSLPGFGSLVGNTCDGSGDGMCLDDMAHYMYEADLAPSLPGQQNVTTYTIGFAADLPILASTAARGGGTYYTVDDTASLSTALTNIVTSILDTQTTFVSPTVAVNSFNRTRNINDLFISVFRATGDVHWPGNLKKYSLDPHDGEILDVNGNPAIDPATDFFNEGARSYWSDVVDGPEVALGGAAQEIPNPAARTVLTYLGNPNLTDVSNWVASGNLGLDNTVLGIGQPGDPSRDEIIAFIRGVDVTDTDQDNITTEPRNQMGDPLHSKPVAMIYDGNALDPSSYETMVYFATNDGYLHAVDGETGEEQWSFIPPEFMPDQVELFNGDASVAKHYGIDGNLTLQTLTDNNGVIEPANGEKVYLYFGARRGGNIYYGLDVTVPNNPKLLWQSDGANLPGVGQSWSTPIPALINIDGAVQNPEKLVLVIGGGYDTTQDNAAGSTDIQGNVIYIVDSVSGDLLWHASQNGSNRNLAKMEYSIPADVRVVDLDSDGFADRMYASDMGGQLWRFDVFNGQQASTLVTGGVIAQLGGAPQLAPPLSDTRRFYSAPDVAIARHEGERFVHIGIGSGHRAHPNGNATENRFYALRDYAPFRPRSQAEYDIAIPITDADLIDITDDLDADVPLGAAGWRFELRDGGWNGEKVLAEARTFGNKVFFTSFTPGATPTQNDCNPALGTNRLYIMDIFNGGPVTNLDESAEEGILTETDRYIEFDGSIPSEVQFLFPSPDDPNCIGEDCTPPPVACVGVHCLQLEFENNPIRTFWSQENIT